MSEEMAPRVWVDVVWDEPMSIALFRAANPAYCCDHIEEAWAQYRREFLPWRLAVRVDDGEEPLFVSAKSYRYFDDAKEDAELVFGRGSTVHLRDSDVGRTELLRIAEDHPSW